MTFTYNQPFTTNRDHVRFYVKDNVEASYVFEDEELDSIIDDQIVTGKALKHAATAAVLTHLQVKFASAGQGMTEKEVDDLRIRWGDSPSADRMIREAITYHRLVAGLRSQATTSVIEML